MSTIESWKVITKDNTSKRNWTEGVTFCGLCDNQCAKVVLGEIYVNQEQYEYEAQICPDCIIKLYNLITST